MKIVTKIIRDYPLLTGVLFALALLPLAGCWPTPKPKPQDAALVEVPESQWPLMTDDMDSASLEEACLQSLHYLRRVPPQRMFSFGKHKISAKDMINGLIRFFEIRQKYVDPVERGQALKREFRLFKSVGSDGKGKVLFTGYYEPVLKASARPQPPYVVPLYALPSDLLYVNLRNFGKKLPKKRLVARVKGNQVIPYYDRQEIDFDQAIKDRAVVLAYVADPVEAFFLHIQGSGQVVFADGSRLRLGYAGTNGHPYRSIGRYLIDQGHMELEGMSMQAIQKFLAQNPKLRKEVLTHNPSYVFFRPLPALGGPMGCYEQPLTAGRSIATDRRIFPGLAPAYVRGERPAIGGATLPLSRFVLNQDTGGAIRGPGRLDLFFGSGPQAGELAGRMKHVGELYFFAPKAP